MPVPPPPIGPFDTSTTFGSGNDSFVAGATNDYLSGGDGRDSLTGGDGNDYIDGGDGNDTLIAGRGDDTVIGGEGDDRIFGGGGTQLLFGGNGNDFIQSGDRDSTLDGGAGNDTLAANAAKGGTIELTGGTGADLFQLTGIGLDRIATITITDFIPGLDSLTIDGQQASVALNQGLVYLMLEGGGFQVTLPTGDILRLTSTATETFSRTFGLTGDDSFTGSDGNDRIFTGSGDDTILAGGGNDLVVGDDGADLIDGGSGDDTLNGLRGNDTIYGGDGNDLIQDSRGFNLLDGGSGDDTIWSGSDSSTLVGGDGDDRLIARGERGGDHLLIGGGGADVFEFAYLNAAKKGDVTIQDFELGIDSLVIMGQDGLTWLMANGFSWADSEAGLVVTYSGGTITFTGLTSEDFAPYVIDDLIIS